MGTPAAAAVAPANGQDQRNRRYDRQLRVWGADGQARLEAARVLLLGASATGSEVLKNLVLGGIAGFTVVDGGTVGPRDTGNNFLVDEAHVGQPKARCITALLQELNESVAGSYVEEQPWDLLQGNPQFLKDFVLVVATQMGESELCRLDALCRDTGCILLAVTSYGLMGYLRPSTLEHRISDCKPDNQVGDLRLCDPWPQLKAYAMSVDLSSLDDVTHKHVPFVVILIQAAEKWKRLNDGALPRSSADKAAFKASIRSMQRQTDGVPVLEENFDEAFRSAFHAWTPYSISPEVRSLLDDDAANPTSTSDNFWVVVAALKEFVEGEGQGQLPLSGSIPDMHSTTEYYIALQEVYWEKARRDVAAVEGHVRHMERRLSRGEGAIPHAYIKHMCRNARNLRVVRHRALQEETAPGSCKARLLQQALGQEDSRPDANLYLLLRAVHRFRASHGRYPGTLDSDVEADVPLLKASAAAILSEAGVSSSSLDDDYVVEMCRFGAAELHVVAAVMGGMAAQESIKLITQQFEPVAGTLIYNGIACTTHVFTL